LVATAIAGEAAELIYEQPALVVWPCSQTMANLRKAGAGVMLGMLSNKCAATGSAGAAADAQRLLEAPQLLEALVQYVEGSKPSGWLSSQVEQLLHLLQRLVKQGLPGARQSAVRVVAALAAGSCELLDSSVFARLAEASAAMGCQDLDRAVERLLQSCAAKQPLRCAQLVEAFVQQPQRHAQLARAAAAALPLTAEVQRGASACARLVQAAAGQAQLQAELAGAAVCSLVARDAASAAPSLVQLVQGVAGQPEVQEQLAAIVADGLLAAGPCRSAASCVGLALALPHMPALQQKLVAALAAALQASPAGVQPLDSLPVLVGDLEAHPQLQEALAAAAWHALVQGGNALCCINLLRRLQGLEVLHQKLSADLEQQLTRNEGNFLCSASQQVVCAVSAFLLGSPQLRGSAYSAFAEACLRRADRQQLLKLLLVAPSLRAALELPGVQRLVEAQIAHLAPLAAPPPFSWCMPEASLPTHPQVGPCAAAPALQAVPNDCRRVQLTACSRLPSLHELGARA
jgi:hypothetical protein